MTTDWFDGATFDPVWDGRRLGTEMRAVYVVMQDGCWRTLDEIQQAIQDRGGRYYSLPSISARLRDFRKERFGSHTVNHRRLGNPSDGLWEYQLVLNRSGVQPAPTMRNFE